MPIAINGSGTLTGLSTGGISDTKAVADTATPAGSVIQVVSNVFTNPTSFSIASTAVEDFTTFQTSITPTFASSKILLLGNLAVGHDGGQFIHVQLMVNGTFTADASKGNAPTNANRRCAHIGLNPPNNQAAGSMPINFLHDHDSTSAQTYHFQFSHTSGQTRNVYLNYGGDTSNSAETGRYICTLTLLEINE